MGLGSWWRPPPAPRRRLSQLRPDLSLSGPSASSGRGTRSIRDDGPCRGFPSPVAAHFGVGPLRPHEPRGPIVTPIGGGPNQPFPVAFAFAVGDLNGDGMQDIAVATTENY